MKTKKRIGFLMVILFSLFLISCGTGGHVGNESGQTDEKNMMVIADKDKTSYIVVRPMNATDAEVKGAVAIKRVLELFTGAAVRITDDYLSPGETPAEKEILVGATNRPESAEAASLLQENGFGIFALNNKIAVCGKNDILLGMSLDYFITDIMRFDPDSNTFTESSGRVQIPASFAFSSEWFPPINGYTIVYSYKELRSREFVAAQLLRERIKDTTGITLPIADDYDKRDREILVGMTSRTESAQIYSDLNKDDKFGGYARIGNKIQIFGVTDSILDAACDYFVRTVLGYDSITGQIADSVDYSTIESEVVHYINGSTSGVERLYNNIVLPEVWPPRTVDFNETKEIDIPYLRSAKDGGTHPETVNIDTGRQLFVDDFLIGSTDLVTSYHTAVPDPDPQIFFDDRLICLSHGGLLYDNEDGLFKMWFLVFNGTRYLRYMTSRDGINWEHTGDSRPLDSAVNYCTVIPNPAPSPDGSDKYIMFTRCGDGSYQWDNHYETARRAGRIYKSSDGANWKYVSESGLCGDATTLAYNHFRNKWVFCLRDYSHFSSAVKRMTRYYECTDILSEGKFGLWQAVEWQRPDILDKPDPEIGCDPEFYSICSTSYESIQIGSFQYWLGPSNNDIHATGLPKITEIQMGYSRDGFYYYRPERNVPLIASSREKGTWDYGYLRSLSSVFVTTDTELWFYYAGYRGGEQQKFAVSPEYSYPSLGRAVLRRDGFASLDGTGSVTTCKLTVNDEKKYLFINARAASVKAELLDEDGMVIDGYSAEECIAFSGDSCSTMLSWQGGKDISFLKDMTFRIRFVMEDGEFYSFWLSESVKGESNGYYGGGLMTSD